MTSFIRTDLDHALDQSSCPHDAADHACLDCGVCACTTSHDNTGEPQPKRRGGWLARLEHDADLGGLPTYDRHNGAFAYNR